MSGIIGNHDVYRAGVRIGGLTVTENGLKTVFACECDYSYDGVLRLAGVSAAGDEYIKIGVLEPGDGMLKLTKSYTKSELTALRLTADAGYYAIAAGETYNAAQRPENLPAEPDVKLEIEKSIEIKEYESEPETESDSGCAAEKKREEAFQIVSGDDTAGEKAELETKPSQIPSETIPVHIEKAQREEKIIPVEPMPREWQPIADASVLFDDPDIAGACRGVKGALTMVRGELTLLAIPVLPGEPFPMMPVFCFGDSIMLDGREYIIFKSKNGNFII